MPGTAIVKRLGIFGGSFNPPHTGHLILAERVCEDFSLDEMCFVPAAIPPHKIGDQSLAQNNDRLAMLELAVAGNPKFSVSTIEMERKGVSYTIDTLQQFALQSPGAELFFLMGSDSLAEFHTWRMPEQICALAQLIIVPRISTQHFGVPAEYAPHVRIAKTPLIEISSTTIRERVRIGKSIRYCVPDGVERYIAEHRLYMA